VVFGEPAIAGPPEGGHYRQLLRAIAEIVELRIKGRDRLLEHAPVRRDKGPAEVRFGTLSRQFQRPAAFVDGTLFGRPRRVGGRSSPRGLFLLGFHRF
jgi:hypothetical protein